ncbi:MOSC domain-containing protein [Fibrella forsythiae]|uniref:MOSC domain-containing protein n=1 Tax=Fibrella forsythiae TaxID=2817061 RepID=A0ABS3JS02_9BACT|nr:MOSC N-terminal beta barrel domain-containing protein [Fibrella forsythiae]MBO0952789.1 MOSC domain-containing protein [Fibrella forsythiae]
MSLTLEQIIIYPIKSLGGVSVSEATIEASGLKYDRRYMLVEPSTDNQADEATEPATRQGRFITQRTVHSMALIDTAINVPENELRVWHRHAPADVLTVPLVPHVLNEPISVSIWDSEDVPAQLVSAEADDWFSRVIGKPCRLVYMPDTTRRSITSRHTRHDELADPIVSFADGFPMLLVTQSSLDELNRRLAESVDAPLTMARFRPNFIVEGLCWPHDEDTWAAIDLDGATFYGVKPCVRCVLTTIDPETGDRGKEPLRTLATYRSYENKILFGENFMPATSCAGHTIHEGASIRVLERKEPWLPVSL